MFQFVSAQNQTYKLDSLVDSYHQSGAPGLAVGVMIDGELMYQKHVGLANLEYDVPINDSTVFGIASITKQMTAACIGVLEHAGKLSVDDDVRLHVPELPDSVKLSKSSTSSITPAASGTTMFYWTFKALTMNIRDILMRASSNSSSAKKEPIILLVSACSTQIQTMSCLR